MSDSEKRKHPRYEIDAVSKIIFELSTIEGDVKDISFGGLFIQNTGSLSEYTSKEVEVKIETTLDGTMYSIKGRGRIARVNEGGVGLFFTGMDDESIKVLNKIIIILSLQKSKKIKKESAG